MKRAGASRGTDEMVQAAEKKASIEKRSTRGHILAFLLMAVFIFELLAYAWCRVQCIRTGYDITRAAREQRQLAEVQKKLQVELARLKSPERLANIAEMHMGLKMPSSRQRVIIE